MALVPFRVSGAAADQGAEERLFQVIAGPVGAANFRAILVEFMWICVMLVG